MFGSVESATRGEPIWLPAVVAAVMTALAVLAAERLVHPAEIVIDSRGFRVRGEIFWRSYTWADVDTFEEQPRGWVTVDFVHGRDPAGWYGVIDDDEGEVIRAFRRFANRTSTSTGELVLALEHGKRSVV